MPALRVCSTPGCPELVSSGHCRQHARPNANARGYTHQHRKTRAEWAPRVSAGLVKCWRCGEPIRAGEPWDLGHLDGSTDYGGPEHAARCNRSAAGRASHDTPR